MPKKDALQLPPGVNWERSPLFDFSEYPSLTAFPDFAREMQVGWLVLNYGGFFEEDKEISLLDIGCGFGEMHHFLKCQRIAKGVKWNYVGVDVDPRKSERALRIYPKIDYRLADITTDLLKAATNLEPYDILVSTEFLEHIDRPSGKKVLAECRELLKHGGHFVLTSANPSLRRDNEWHIYEWPPEQLLEYLKAIGWEIVDAFYMKAGVRDIRPKITEDLKNRIPNEMLRGVLSCVAEKGSVTVAVLRNP